MLKYTVIDKLEYAERIATAILDHCKRFKLTPNIPSYGEQYTERDNLNFVALDMVSAAIDCGVQRSMVWASEPPFEKTPEYILTVICPWYKPNLQSLDDLVDIEYRNFCTALNYQVPFKEFLKTEVYADTIRRYNNSPETDDLEDSITFGVISDILAFVESEVPLADRLYTIRDLPDFCVVVDEGSMYEVKRSIECVNTFNWRLTGFELSPNLLMNEVVKPENMTMQKWFGHAISQHAAAAKALEGFNRDTSNDDTKTEPAYPSSYRHGKVGERFTRIIRQIKRDN